MSDCPCCSSQLLQHISQGRIEWFCPNCRQIMPCAKTCSTCSNSCPAIEESQTF